MKMRLRFRSLAGRYAAVASGLTLTMLLASGGMEMYFSFVDARAQIGRSQAVQAKAAAAEIGQYVSGLRGGLRSVAQLPWSQAGFDTAARREEFYRLMSLFPAIIELQLVDADGRERLSVSRRQADRVGSGQPVTLTLAQRQLGPAGSEFGDPYFLQQAQPFVTLAIAGKHDRGAITLATLDLRFLDDLIAGLRVDGQILIVDRANMLVAHTRATHVLRHLDLSSSPGIAIARKPLAQRESAASGFASVDLDGKDVFATATPVLAPGWLLLVEQPRSQALRPALATLGRTLGLLAVAALVAFAASLVFARRLAAPIVRMRQATARIAGGDLASRVAVDSEDELGRLGRDFNQMALALQASYAGLEERISQRTQELSQARDAAERASSAKTRFLAAASHDLRQPMHTIGLLATVLRNRLDDEQDRQLAAKLQSCASLMEGLFAGLLDISKLDAGAVRPRPETFVVAELLFRIGAQFEPQAAHKGITLRVRACRAIVHTDPGILERMLVNLVSNAVRYTQRGAVRLGCRRRGDRLAVQVIDTGPGIASRHQAAIFDEFVRLDETLSPQDKGLGLGLSIVKRSAQVLGVEVRLFSQPGRGSKFEIVLPSIGMVSSPAGPAAQEDTSGGDAALRGAFVLVLDDDEGNRHALEASCAQWGCSVLAVDSIAAAQAELSRHLRSPDLIVTDLQLGSDGDGFGAIDTIRAYCGEPIPSLVVTADVSGQASVPPGYAGVQVLHKPVSAARLRAAFQQALHASGAAATQTAV